MQGSNDLWSKRQILIMKILIVSVDFPPHTDGVSTVAHELATRLADAGEEITVIGPKSRNDREYDARQKFRVIRTPWYDLGYLRFIPIFFLMPYAIIKYRVKTVIPMNIAYGGIIAHLFHKWLGFSYILWAYGLEFAKFENNPFIRRLYLKIYDNAVFIVAITDFVKQQLIKFGVSPKKVTVIKPGTDPQKYHPIKVSDSFKRQYGLENKRIILSVGRLIERKGIDMTISAMQDVVKEYPEAIYLVVGQGPFRSRLEALSYKLGVANHVRFAGRVADDKLLNFYNLCDLLIMASRTIGEKGDIEGFGIVFLEANACQKPVIGGLDGGMREAIENGVTGLLVNSSNPKEISTAIIKILSDKEYAGFMGVNGRKRVAEELNWKRTIEEFHRELLAQ